MPTSYHMVHYRRLVVKPAAGVAACDMLCRNALDQVASGAQLPLWKRATDRLWEVPEQSRQLMLNRVADLTSGVFGEMCLLQSGGFQALLELQASQVQLSDKTIAEVFDLTERSAPTGSQFIRGMAYWLLIGNHMFFVKTQSMTTDHLRTYIDWLLRTKAGLLAAAAEVTLQAEFDRSQLAGDIGDIRSVRVSGVAPNPIQVATAALEDQEPSTRVVPMAKHVAEKFVEFAQALPVVRALLGEEKTSSLVDSLGPNEYLSVDASVKIRGRRTAESRERIRQIATDLADITDGRVQVEGKDGRLSDDDAILRTRMPFNLAHEGSNLLEFDNVADQLQEVYSRFVRDGKIPAS